MAESEEEEYSDFEDENAEEAPVVNTQSNAPASTAPKPSTKAATAAAAKTTVTKPKNPAPATKKPAAKKTPRPPATKRAPASQPGTNGKVVGAPQQSPKSARIAVAPVNQIITAPPDAAEQIFEDRIVDASGKTIKMDSPRLKRAFVKAGVVVEELQPVPMLDFIKEAEGQGLPSETGLRRFYAFESTRQGAVDDLLTARKEIAAALAKNRWAGAGEKLTTIRRMFDMIDADRSGTLELPEFTILTKSLGLNMLPYEIASTFKAMDKDGGGSVDFDEFTAFYMDAEDAGRANKGKRLGKEMIANLHANLFNASIQEAKSKMGAQMLKERARYTAAVKRLEDAETRKQNAHLEVEKRKLEHDQAMREKEREANAVYEKAVKETFKRQKEKEEAARIKVDKDRKDLVKQLRQNELEKNRRYVAQAQCTNTVTQQCLACHGARLWAG